jgi:predicted oxidoreductase
MAAALATVECDVLVAGSGAGGLAAAITARKLGLEVIVAEKAAVYGGTTARSGGWLWIPGNPLAREAGIADDAAAARRYLAHEAGNFFDAARVDAFLAAGPEMVAFSSATPRCNLCSARNFPTITPMRRAGLRAGARFAPLPSMPARSGRRRATSARRSAKSPFLA